MHQPTDVDGSTTGSPDHTDDAAAAGTPVVVRRNAGLAALVGAGASAIAIAYLWRASASGAPLDWALCLVMAAIAALNLANLVDARTPLLVADDLGVRIRLGNQWRGLPWDAVDRVVVQPRQGLLRDGRLMFAPHSLSRALDGLDARGRRAAALNQKLYGAALAVPMGLTTRFSARGEELADGLAALAQGRADVVVVTPEPKPRAEAERRGAPRRAEAGAEGRSRNPGRRRRSRRSSSTRRSSLAEQVDRAGRRAGGRAGRRDDRQDEDRPVRRSLLGGLGTIVSRVAKGRSHDVDAEHPTSSRPTTRTTRTEGRGRRARPRAGRPVRRTAAGHPPRAARPDHPRHPGDRARQRGPAPRPVRRGRPPSHVAAGGPRAAPAGQRRPGVRGRAVGVRRSSPAGSARSRRLGDAVDALVIDGFVTEPAYDPVIGPELSAARVRVGPERRRPRRAHPHPPARHRVDRGRRLRAVRWRLLRPRPPAHARPGAGQGPRRRCSSSSTTATPRRRSTPAGCSRPSWRPG